MSMCCDFFDRRPDNIAEYDQLIENNRKYQSEVGPDLVIELDRIALEEKKAMDAIYNTVKQPDVYEQIQGEYAVVRFTAIHKSIKHLQTLIEKENDYITSREWYIENKDRLDEEKRQRDIEKSALLDEAARLMTLRKKSTFWQKIASFGKE